MLAALQKTWQLRLPKNRSLNLGGVPRVMGIVNITPDSFSDGGRFFDPTQAVEHGLRLVEEGAEILDLGAESTRPGGGVYGAGADEVDVEEELRRLLPVLSDLRAKTDAILSVDTRKGAVARAALAAGADLINDVGGLADPDLAPAVAEAGCPLVLMHSRGNLRTMQREVSFTDVVAEVRDELADLVDQAVDAGIDPGQLIVDPGIGFGKTVQQNLRLIGELNRLAKDLPVLLGASRKSFIAGTLSQAGGEKVPPDQRLGGSLAAVAAAFSSAAVVRVHDVAETVQFIRVLAAISDPDAVH